MSPDFQPLFRIRITLMTLEYHADPDQDPNSTFHFDADTDPTNHFLTDSDP